MREHLGYGLQTRLIMKSKKLTLHKSTVRQLGSESLRTFRGGAVPAPIAPAPAPYRPSHPCINALPTGTCHCKWTAINCGANILTTLHTVMCGTDILLTTNNTVKITTSLFAPH